MIKYQELLVKTGGDPALLLEEIEKDPELQKELMEAAVFPYNKIYEETKKQSEELEKQALIINEKAGIVDQEVLEAGIKAKNDAIKEGENKAKKQVVNAKTTATKQVKSAIPAKKTTTTSGKK